MISPLLTDLYQLTMAYGYWKLGIHEREAVFHQIFRKQPFRGNYSVACGLGSVIEFLQEWRFAEDDLSYLQTLRAFNGSVLFSNEFLDYLRDLRFSCDIDAVLEGNIVFPHEPLLRVKGPLLQCQLLESTLLNIINFQTLIATKAARVCQACDGDPVLEFGMRRAQGPDGALSASRAAYIGGCVATSNVLAGKRYGIPVSGTHAHSWVSAFEDEITAFKAYAEVMPHNCVLLVDTYDTVQGVKHAIKIGEELKAVGAELRAIRLDSGDLAVLSIKARELLDAAGFSQTKIIASNSLDEYVIAELKQQNAQISVWGVGTHLSTAYDHPALDGVYKLSALRDAENKWQYKLKLSEQAVKVSNPGIHQVRRFYRNKQPIMDVIYDLELGMAAQLEWVSLEVPHTTFRVESYDEAVDLLQPIFRAGQLVYPIETIETIRLRAIQQVKEFLPTHKMAPYSVGLESGLHQLKQELIAEVASANNKIL
ncbi:MAG: nicotinate phosphoribosyltransferase [Gammaproteobacteria bacterium]